jgi:cytochrome b561
MRNRHDLLMQVLHWSVALLVLAIYATGLGREAVPKGDGRSGSSCGVQGADPTTHAPFARLIPRLPATRPISEEKAHAPASS